MDSPTLVTSEESSATLLLPATTFGVTAVTRLGASMLNVTGSKYACIAAVIHIPVMLVLRLFRASAVKAPPQVQRSLPSAVPKSPHSNSPPKPPNANVTPPRRRPSHQPPQPRPWTFRGLLLQELLKGTFGTSAHEQCHPPQD